MPIVTIQADGSQLSRLVDEAAEGAEIIIARDGRPVARLVSIAAPRPHRVPGRLAGRLHVPAEFDAALPDDLLDAFEGR